MIRRPPRSTLFPYTRSSDLRQTPPLERRWRLPTIHPDRDGRWSRRGECHRRSEEHTSELQSRLHLVCRLLLEKKKKKKKKTKKYRLKGRQLQTHHNSYHK